jgi:hypothetical protein
MRSMRAILFGGICALSACATGPTPVAGVPGPNKDPASFQKDELACRTEAGQALYASPPNNGTPPAPVAADSNAQWQIFFTRYAQCQTAKGNSVVAIPWSAAYAQYLGYDGPSGYGAPAYAYGYGYPGPYADPYYYDEALFWGDPFLYGWGGAFGYGYGYGRFGGHFGGGFGHFGGGFRGGGGHR